MAINTQLPPEHCDMCKKAIEIWNEVAPFAQQCKECGLPVDHYIESMLADVEMNKNMLRVFHGQTV